MFSATVISAKSARSCQITAMPALRARVGVIWAWRWPKISISAPGSGW
jgi:hypothetical protein